MYIGLIMDTNQKGKITEIEVLSHMLKLGYSVSVPFGDKDRYDQIWDINGKLLRVQIKTCRARNEEESAIIFRCSSKSNGNEHYYSAKEIDGFATFWKNEVYFIPIEECSSEKTLWFTPPKNGCKSCSYAENYTVERIINTF